MRGIMPLTFALTLGFPALLHAQGSDAPAPAATDASKPADSDAGDASNESATEKKPSHAERVAELVKQYSRTSRFDDKNDAISADRVAAEVRKRFPNLDLTRHDISNIQNPTELAERESYTRNMLTLIEVWNACGAGGQLELVLAEQFEEKSEDLVYLTLISYQATLWPVDMSQQARQEPRNWLKLIVDTDDNYLAAHLLLARILGLSDDGATTAVTHLDKVLASERNDDAVREMKVEAWIVKANTMLTYRSVFGGALTKAIEACESAVKAQPRDENMLNMALGVLRETLSQEKLEELLRAALDTSPPEKTRAVLLLHVAHLRLRQKKYSEATEFADQALALIDAARLPEVYFTLVRRIHIQSLLRQRAELLTTASDPKAANASEEGQALLKKLEERFKALIEHDLKHLSPSFQTQSEAAKDYAMLLRDNSRLEEAIATLRDYDKRAVWMRRASRVELRVMMDRMHAELTGSWPIETWQNAYEVKDFAGLAEDLKDALLTHVSDPAKYVLNDAALLEFVSKVAADGTTGPASADALRLLGAALRATPAPDGERITSIEKVAKERLEKLGAAPDKSDVDLMRACFSTLAASGTKSGLLAITACLDRYAASLDDLDSFRDLALPDAVKLVRESALLGEAAIGEEKVRELRSLGARAEQGLSERHVKNFTSFVTTSLGA